MIFLGLLASPLDIPSHPATIGYRKEPYGRQESISMGLAGVSVGD